MAIGPSGGSAASRFRPRGTAPAAGVGLGRRTLLAEEGVAEESNTPQEEAPQESAASAVSQVSSFVRRAQAAQAAVDNIIEGEVTQPDPSTSANASSSTETAPSRSLETNAPPRGRGRPAGRTKTDVSLGSPAVSPTTDQGALSVPAARARMREIENEVKAVRANLQTQIAALHKEADVKVRVLKAEFQDLANVVLGE
jgi:hypothetical protein